jgi:hypothetical protein
LASTSALAAGAARSTRTSRATESGLRELERRAEHLVPGVALVRSQHGKEFLVEFLTSCFHLLAHFLEVALAEATLALTLAATLAALTSLATANSALALTLATLALLATTEAALALSATLAAWATGSARSTGTTVFLHDLAHLLDLISAQP